MTLDGSIRAFCQQYGADRKYWLAFSGGLDSQVLLDLLVSVRADLGFDLTAIHVNHGLSINASRWAQHCRSVCAKYGVDFIERTLELTINNGDSLEEIARERRYQVFEGYMRDGDILLTAHQQDDQAETLLLQLLRGAGLKGLAAMPLIKPFSAGSHARPLLSFDRAELEKYANERKLHWIEDESNQNISFTRNYLRHHVLTPLKSKWPTVTATLSRSAAHCAEAQSLLTDYARDLSATVAGTRPDTLSVRQLLLLNPEKQRLVLRHWMHQSGFDVPNTKKMTTIQLDVLLADRDRLPVVSWGNNELRRFRDDLYLMKKMQPHSIKTLIAWDFTAPFTLPDGKALYADLMLGQGLCVDLPEVRVGFRQGGEKIDVPGRGMHTLKNLFQEWGVLPWERDRVPLLYSGDVLIAVVGYCIDGKFAAKGTEMGRVLSIAGSRISATHFPG